MHTFKNSWNNNKGRIKMCQLINVIGKIELGKKKTFATSNIMIDSGKDQQHMLNLGEILLGKIWFTKSQSILQ